MNHLPNTKQGYPVRQFTYDEWQLIKDKPKAGIILAKRKVNPTTP